MKTLSPSSKKIIFLVNGAKATESDPINVELSEIPSAKGLPFRDPASKFKFLKMIAIANAPSSCLSIFFIAISGSSFFNS